MQDVPKCPYRLFKIYSNVLKCFYMAQDVQNALKDVSRTTKRFLYGPRCPQMFLRLSNVLQMMFQCLLMLLWLRKLWCRARPSRRAGLFVMSLHNQGLTAMDHHAVWHAHELAAGFMPCPHKSRWPVNHVCIYCQQTQRETQEKQEGDQRNLIKWYRHMCHNAIDKMSRCCKCGQVEWQKIKQGTSFHSFL